MELLVCIAIAYIIRNTFIDGAYAIRGQTPPRTKVRLAKIKAAASSGGGSGRAHGPRRYGMSDYVRDAWHDAMEDARETRVSQRLELKAAARAATGQRTAEDGARQVDVPTIPRARRPDADDPPPARPGPHGAPQPVASDGARPARPDDPPPARPGPASPSGPAGPDPMSPSARHAYEWGWLNARDGGEPPADSRPEFVAGWNDRRAGKYLHPDGTVIPADEREKRIHADREGKCSFCGQREATQTALNTATGEQRACCAVCGPKLAQMHPVPTPDPASLAPAAAAAASPEPAGDTAPQDEPTPGLARVIPITSTSTKEEPQMTTNTSEITGLVSAQAYAAAMAENFNNSETSVEEFTSSLAGFDVSGEAVDAAAHAQECQQAAAAAWEQVHAALAKQDQVKEAYEAVPEAGTKEFVTSE